MEPKRNNRFVLGRGLTGGGSTALLLAIVFAVGHEVPPHPFYFPNSAIFAVLGAVASAIGVALMVRNRTPKTSDE